MKKLLYIALFTSLFSGCIFYDDCYFNNKTNDTLCIYMSIGYFACSPTQYPDTTLPLKEYYNDGEGDRSYLMKIPPQSNKFIFFNMDFDGFTREYLKSDTFSIFVLSSDTVKKYSWDEIRNQYKVLVRYDIGARQYKSMGFTVEYPPAPWMKDVKMYPPYETFVKDKNKTK